MSSLSEPASSEATGRDDQQSESATRRLTQLYRRIVRVLNGGFLLGTGLILLGLVIAIIRRRSIASDSDPLLDVLPAALRLDPQGIVELGILTLVATPVAYVIVSLATFIRQRDMLFVIVCIVLLAIIGGSIGIALS
jgi:uncharacterized membrane protein